MDYIVCELHSIILVLIKLVKDNLRIPMGDTRSRKSKKDRQHNDQKKNDKRTNNDI
jgi:hypothetical protein